jgi:hypothetical protein
MMEDKYVALLRQVNEFCWREAAGSGNSTDPFYIANPLF